jgi:hypothetical protein
MKFNVEEFISRYKERAEAVKTDLSLQLEVMIGWLL